MYHINSLSLRQHLVPQELIRPLATFICSKSWPIIKDNERYLVASSTSYRYQIDNWIYGSMSCNPHLPKYPPIPCARSWCTRSDIVDTFERGVLMAAWREPFQNSLPLHRRKQWLREDYVGDASFRPWLGNVGMDPVFKSTSSSSSTFPGCISLWRLDEACASLLTSCWKTLSTKN